MWLMIAREPAPDAPYWPGRRWLAAVDAVVWPMVWVVLIQASPRPLGTIGSSVAALAVLAGMERLHRAVCVNHRYRFTTWRWGRVAAALLLIGLILEFALR
jgi:hypothetical protein